MAKKTEGKSEAPAAQKPLHGRKLLEQARKHQDPLMATGMSATVLDRYETALKGLEHKGEINPASQVLIRDLQSATGEFQAAMRKEFPSNTSFQAIFKANEPMPTDPRAVLALGRLIAAEAPNFSANLIRYALNAATVKHVTSLCDQLEKELGGADPVKDAKALEEQIQDAARKAFEGKPELSAFGLGGTGA